MSLYCKSCGRKKKSDKGILCRSCVPMKESLHIPISEYACICGKDFSEYEHGRWYLKSHLKNVKRRKSGYVRIPLIKSHVELKQAKMAGLPDKF